jgi:hypothetical protein
MIVLGMALFLSHNGIDDEVMPQAYSEQNIELDSND